MVDHDHSAPIWSLRVDVHFVAYVHFATFSNFSYLPHIGFNFPAPRGPVRRLLCRLRCHLAARPRRGHANAARATFEWLIGAIGHTERTITARARLNVAAIFRMLRHRLRVRLRRRRRGRSRLTGWRGRISCCRWGRRGRRDGGCRHRSLLLRHRARCFRRSRNARGRICHWKRHVDRGRNRLRRVRHVLGRLGGVACRTDDAGRIGIRRIGWAELRARSVRLRCRRGWRNRRARHLRCRFVH